jgi:type II secretory pathway pseudopilin PulG
MVHSRSETNLNRIFFDLCTSPDIRNQHSQQRNNQRQYHPPLPNISELRENLTESSTSVDSEQRDIPTAMIEEKSPKSTAIPLAPVESTGFTVQTPSYLTNPSFKLFETLTINHTKKSSSNQENKKNDTVSLPSNSSNISQDWKQQDFANRLQDRLKSRKHLRRFFLS